MKKKVLSMLLAAAMVCSLAACGTKETKKTDSSEDKVLTVAMECGYAPYNWTQSDDSNGAVPIKDSKDYAYGYDVMMAKKIADELGTIWYDNCLPQLTPAIMGEKDGWGRKL